MYLLASTRRPCRPDFVHRLRRSGECTKNLQRANTHTLHIPHITYNIMHLWSVYIYILWISQRTLSLCISIHLWWILIKTLLNIFQPGIPVQASREGNKPCFMCLSVLGLRTSRGGRGRDPKHLQPFDRGRSPFSCGQLYRGILGFGSLAC